MSRLNLSQSQITNTKTEPEPRHGVVRGEVGHPALEQRHLPRGHLDERRCREEGGQVPRRGGGRGGDGVDGQ